jgi:hypothetical protein
MTSCVAPCCVASSVLGGNVEYENRSFVCLLARSLALTGVLVALPTPEALACANWNPAFTMVTQSGNESAAYTSTWAGSLDHYEVCWNRSTTPPGSPLAADRCESAGAGLSKSYRVHRSNRTHAATVFACDNATCTDYFSLGGSETITSGADDGSATTEAEQWVLSGVTSLSDSSRAVSTSGANAARVVHVPSAWANPGVMAMWYSVGGSPEHIYSIRTSGTSWPTGGDRFNDTSLWSSPVEVLTGISGAGTVYGKPTHPWVMPRYVGSGTDHYFYQLFVHASSDGSAPTDIFSVRSLEDAGEDFDMECTTSGGCDAYTDTCPNGGFCAWDDASYAALELCSTGGVACDYIRNAGHGGIAWDYVLNTAGVNLLLDEPMMFFTGAPDGAVCSDQGTAADDIYLARWNGSIWDLDLDGGGCPASYLDDFHDPGITPLPFDEFKVYVQERSEIGFDFWVYYWDGSALVDGAQIEIYFDGAGAIDENCLENIDTFVHVSGGNLHEGAFFKATADTSSNDCFTTGGGIVFAELDNG